MQWKRMKKDTKAMSLRLACRSTRTLETKNAFFCTVRGFLFKRVAELQLNRHQIPIPLRQSLPRPTNPVISSHCSHRSRRITWTTLGHIIKLSITERVLKQPSQIYPFVPIPLSLFPFASNSVVNAEFFQRKNFLTSYGFHLPSTWRTIVAPWYYVSASFLWVYFREELS